MPGSRLKGQFFMLGALLLCTAFFLALPSQVILTGSPTSDIEALAENLESELPHSLNLAMLEDGSPDKLGDFTQFLIQSTQDRYLTMESLWVVTVPDLETGDVEVYAGKYLGAPVTLYITIDSTQEALALSSGETNSETFSGVGSDFDISLSFGDRVWSGQLPRDKVNIYDYLSITRGENSVVREIIA